MQLLDAHAEAMSVFDRAVRAVGPQDWDKPTPCADWSVRDLVNHLVAEQLWTPYLLAGKTVADIGGKFDGDVLGADPLGRWSSASERSRGTWTEAGALGRRVHLSYGTVDAPEYGWQMTVDLAVHGWDLATALGRDAGIGDELARTLHEVAEPQVAHWSGAGIFAAPVPVGEAPRRWTGWSPSSVARRETPGPLTTSGRIALH